ncbi:MAG: hypothetical protein J6034_11355 [Bacteroidaceae bacterium]|nr:hypothetical protein [Bacteroidaceae bacterium]
MKKLFTILAAMILALPVFAATSTTVYYAVSSSTVGSYTVKLNVAMTYDNGTAGNFQQYAMTKTSYKYLNYDVYSCTYTDWHDGVGTLQFQLYSGDDWQSQQQPIGMWTAVGTYNGKMYVHGDGYTWTDFCSFTISAVEWATLCSDKILDFTNAGVDAYIVTGHSGTAITKSQLSTEVPENTPLLLNADAGTYFIKAIGSTSVTVSGNLLKQGAGSLAYNATYVRYVLSVNDNGTGSDASDDYAEFKKIVDGTPATVPTDKAYLEFSASAFDAPSAIRLTDDENGATDINNVKAIEEGVKFFQNGKLFIKKNNVVYDMMGAVVK